MYSKRQEALLNFIQAHKSVRREEIETFLNTAGFSASKITVLRDLNVLLKNGLIVKTGNAKATLYAPSPRSALLEQVDVEEYFGTDQDLRKNVKISFNFDIFKSLSNLLTETEKTELALLNETYRKKRDALPPNLRQKEFERLTVELAWKSSKIEGNTYTLLDTERLLKENVSAKGKTAEETKMVLNHKTALDYVLQSPEYFRLLSVSKIEEVHRLLTSGLQVASGIRQGMVGIVGTNYRPLDNGYQIKEALQHLISTVNQTENPVEKALIAVLMIAYIQPFEDGNKRTSRILGNALLLADDYCPLSYRSVDEIEYKKGIILFYEQNNASYFKQLFLEQFRQAVKKYF